MNKKLKIAIIGSRGYPYVYSGYETLVRELSERLANKGHHVKVYCHRSLFINKPKFINGIELVYTPSIETKFLSQISNSFFSFIHVCFSDTDVVLVVNSANGPFGFLTKIFQKKTCINVDGLEWLRPKWKGLGSLYFKLSSKMATIFFDKIINDSKEMRKVYLKLFNTDSTVISYGAKVKKSSKPSLIKLWNLKKLDYYLIIGRLIPDNNADMLVKGFLSTKTCKKLVIVGDVKYKDQYATNLKSIDDDRLIFTGYIENQDILSELYHNCYVYLHGHEFGGTNPTMIKAMAYGTAILALTTPFNKEMLQNNKFGLFFKKNIESLANLINLCEKDPAMVLNMKKNSVKGISNIYNWDYITNQYLDLFNELVS